MFIIIYIYIPIWIYTDTYLSNVCINFTTIISKIIYIYRIIYNKYIIISEINNINNKKINQSINLNQ